MKKLYLLILLLLTVTAVGFSQSVPMGMKYQAVARSLDGSVIANKAISLKISLTDGAKREANRPGGEVYYSETHQVRTNSLGLFELTVGEGNTLERGLFDVPWSENEIWMEIAIDETGGNRFVTINSSRLLAVPYAFHAGTAGGLAPLEDGLRGYGSYCSTNGGVPSVYWDSRGNCGTNPAKHKLGTTDFVALVLVTNNLPGLTIQAAGDIDIRRSLSIGANLTVDSNVYLNRIAGSTINYGPFTVERMSPSYLTGTLTVDKHTELNSTLNVDGATTLQSTLDVKNMAATTLTGTLTVDKHTELNSTLNVDGATTLQSTLDVKNMAATTLTGTLTVDKHTELNSTLNVDGATTLQSTLDVKNSAATNLTGTLTVGGVTTVNNTLKVNGSSSYIAEFVNSTDANGISIQVANGTPANANNFVTFRNSGGGTVGRIEGETLSELHNSDDYKQEKGALDLAVTLASISVATAAVDIVLATASLVGASTSSTVCAGLGACVTAPVPSLIVAATANEIAVIANAVAVAIGLDAAIDQRDFFVSSKDAAIGVTYASGAGDYAEWLPKANLTEKFKPGYIVGMKNGRISLNTDGADKLFAISTKPIVLGNMPTEGKEAEYEKVAFMGQIPVHVIGKVQAGDYILPSGFNNGFAKAVSPSKMKADDYAKIVGMAWSSGTSDTYNQINVAIGLNTGDISKVVAEQSREINELKKQKNETNAILAKLVPGYREAAGLTEVDIAVAQRSKINTSIDEHGHVEYITPDASNIIYFEISREQLLEGVDLAEKMFVESGGNLDTHPFWSRMKTNAEYKDAVLKEMQNKFKNALHTHKEINSGNLQNR